MTDTHETCVTCGGRGIVRQGQGLFVLQVGCPQCGGKGKVLASVQNQTELLKKALEDLVHWKFTRNQRAQMKIMHGEDNPYERACKILGKE